MASIFVLEDEENIRELVYYALKSDGYKVTTFGESRQFWKHMRLEKPSLILLDLMLPGESGFDILAALKQSKDTESIPVVILTAIRDSLKSIEGLDSGADDYITKPFCVDELLARIRAVLRRTASPNSKEGTSLALGDIVLDTQTRIVWTENTEVILTYLEFELLYCLLQHKNLVMSRDQLLDLVWKPGDDGGPADRNVDMQIRALRKKLGGCGDMIKTVRGVGYKISI
ncbi:MAG: response regulator transcription factor [Defluviitaleaceae bacterium]|nr:response regulator transcription factor [Defluviitaleaceae bacterium]